ncbi:MAG: flagellar hook basal-body protein [Deltaproteobacteria bacterium]|nr:flagellar hook basal-body protein [Deltaproteobacteria bacterium]
MDAGIFSAMSGSLAAQTRLDALANNLANANTVGFKAERVLQRAERAGDVVPPPTAVPTPVTRDWVETDFGQGSINKSGNPLDVALAGEGFFVVKTERGDRLTRSGDFAIDAAGYLATSDGSRVQGTSGDISIPKGPVVFGADGSVRAGDQSVGQLRIVTVENPGKLVRESGTRFAAGDLALTDAARGSVQIVQGATESANLSPVEGLVAMIETVRGFETYMRAAERLDQMTSKAINDVGRV